MIDFRPVDRRQADNMFTALPKESKWAEVTATLMSGQPVFIPYMNRIQLETLRNIIDNRHAGAKLRSRSVEWDGTPGKVLRVEARMDRTRPPEPIRPDKRKRQAVAAE